MNDIMTNPAHAWHPANIFHGALYNTKNTKQTQIVQTDTNQTITQDQMIGFWFVFVFSLVVFGIFLYNEMKG